MPLKLAIVGLGKIARDQHVPAIAATPGVELVAVASRHAWLDGVANFASLDELLAQAPEVEAIAFCTPPQGRHLLAVQALKAGKHVLMEKPPGATVAEIEPLTALARDAGKTLFATWHSRFAPAVAKARARLSRTRIRSIRIDWKEDVRIWHPGQDWLWEPGGLGVFDPGINALSILTAVLPNPVFVAKAELHFPANKAAPIAAELELSNAAGLPIRAEFDFRQTGPQTWDIRAETDQGEIVLSLGGARLVQAGETVIDEKETEYQGIYRRFVELAGSGTSDVDLTPLGLVADAFLVGRRHVAEAFEDKAP